MVLGIGMGAGWGMIMANRMGGDVSVGLTMGAGAGLVIALVSGAAVYREATG